MTTQSYTFYNIKQIEQHYSFDWIGDNIPVFKNPLHIINEFYTKIPALKTILDHIQNKTTPHHDSLYTGKFVKEDYNPFSLENAEIQNKSLNSSLRYETKRTNRGTYKTLSLNYSKRYCPLGRYDTIEEDQFDHIVVKKSDYDYIDNELLCDKIITYNFEDNWLENYDVILPDSLTEHEKIEWMKDVKDHPIPEPITHTGHVWNAQYGFNLIKDCITWIIQNIMIIDPDRFAKPETISPLFDVFLDPESMLILAKDLDDLKDQKQ